MGEAVQTRSPLPLPLQITVVVCAGPRETREYVLQLPTGATVADALEGLTAQMAISGDAAWPMNPGQGDGEFSSVAVGVWGRLVARDALLGPSDRLEIYRPLIVDPKVARRERFARQGARTTGLFARSRVGGKSGY